MASPTSAPAFFSTAVQSSRRFLLDLAPAEETDLAVVCGGVERCTPGYTINRKSFPYHSVELVVGGAGRATIDGAEYALAAGSVFTYAPGVPHRLQTDPQRPLQKYFVDFAGREAATLLRDAGVPAGSCSRVRPIGDVQPIFEELVRDGHRVDRRSSQLCVALLRCLALRISASLSRGEPNGTGSFATFNRCRDFIDENAEQLTSLNEVARRCGVAPSYLARLFQRYGQSPPYQYLLRARMGIAAQRLAESSMTVQSVADSLGYSDPFHFSRTFKSAFGVSPSAFRRLR